MKISRLVRIGLFFAFSIVILFWGINFLKGKKLLQPEKLYYSEYSKIGGLTGSSPVTINGFQVGKVKEISLNDFRTGRISVKFVVNYPGLEIPVGSKASIISTDLMGTKAIEILLSDSPDYHKNADTLPGIIEGDLRDQVNAQMLPLKQSAEELMSSMDSVLIALQMIFGPANRENLAQSFESITQTIKNLEKTTIFIDGYVKEESKKFSFILSNTDSLATGLKNRRAEIDKIITNLATFSDTLKEVPLNDVADRLNLILDDMHELMGGILEGEGNLGRLNNDDSLYLTLEEASDNLNRLLADIRHNPKRYIRLSAFDMGKTIIASNDSELLNALNEKKDQQYFVCLVKSTIPLEADHPAIRDFKDISFIQVDGIYYYYIKETQKLDQGIRLVSKYLSDYPDAGLYTWIGNNWQRIDF